MVADFLDALPPMFDVAGEFIFCRAGADKLAFGPLLIGLILFRDLRF